MHENRIGEIIRAEWFESASIRSEIEIAASGVRRHAQPRARHYLDYKTFKRVSRQKKIWINDFAIEGYRRIQGRRHAQGA